MGDFNVILRGEDKNTTVMEAEIRDFENLVTNAGLHELKTIGRFFTWSNSHIHSKIDRALVNGYWMRKWPHLEVEVKDPHFSDHSLLCVSVKEVQNRYAKLFKFLNYLTSHAEFQHIVAAIWSSKVQSCPMEKIWKKLKLMKGDMKELNSKEFSNVETKVQSFRKQLKDVHILLRTSLTDQQLYDEEKKIKRILEKWILVEESILRQNLEYSGWDWGI
ncbi:hypothetical protein P3L10_018997 [Capsicum annuum]|uniref:uncharacterized protein LOC107874188 n=1 Tax=Capsicum annuum TaxID=4072 RepID=UPI0007BF54EB|nr:uncharacterized protein LOC107874188 [Capsicum annuum]